MIRTMLILLCIIFLVSVNNSCANEDLPPPPSKSCLEVPACAFKAKKKTWPSEIPSTNSVKFSNLMFDLLFPKDINKVSIVWGKLTLYAVALDKNQFFVGVEEVPPTETSTNYKAIKKAKKNSAWKPIDIIKIIFNNDLKDTEPSNAYERYLWRTAFLHKSIQYNTASEVYMYSSGLWNVYTAKVNEVTHKRLTIVTHDSIPDRYLTIRDTGANLDTIERIFSSVSLPNND